MLRFQTCGEGWLALLRHVTSAGEQAEDDRGPVLEAPPTLFEMACPATEPGADPVLRAASEPAKVALYARKFTEDQVVPPFKYSYGQRLRHLQGVDQLGWACDLLANRPSSKSAWVPLTVPGERPDAVPCLAAVALRLRQDKLTMSAMFRSQNAYTAYLNYLPLRAVQTQVATRLGKPCGPMQVYIDVPHVYLADLAMVTRILTAGTARQHPASRMLR
jgi:thymidylate synthase